MLQDNLREVQKKIKEACSRSGRSAADVTLCAVSKTKPEEDILTLYDAGQRDFGENYIQELRKKHDDLPKDIRWHMIGHLQRNKVKYIAEYIHMIHSVDSLELAQTIEKEAAKHDRIIPILIEVNIAGEDTKFGLAPSECIPFIESIKNFEHLRIRGLMTIAPYTEDPESNRQYFRGLKELLNKANEMKLTKEPMDTLSMGMTGDYEVAIEEGATLVRVGTGIFGERNYAI